MSEADDEGCGGHILLACHADLDPPPARLPLDRLTCVDDWLCFGTQDLAPPSCTRASMSERDHAIRRIERDRVVLDPFSPAPRTSSSVSLG